jgi:hypothetical protein
MIDLKEERNGQSDTGKEKVRRKKNIFLNLLGQAFWRDGRKTFISGATRLPATDLGVLFSLYSCVNLFEKDNDEKKEKKNVTDTLN